MVRRMTEGDSSMIATTCRSDASSAARLIARRS